MATTVTTSQSWFSRLGDSVKNVFIGFLLVIGSIILLFWNEGRAVATYQSLKEGSSAVVSVSSETKDPANDGKLIHITGDARTPSVLTDTDFGVGGNFLKLKRTVELYQWEEDTDSKTVEKLGGGTETTTTYTYKKDWSDDIIESSSFKEPEEHQNPTAKLFENEEWLAQNVSVGAYSLSDELLEALSGYVAITPTKEMLEALPYATQQDIQLVGNLLYYRTSEVTNPQIGNTRIGYEAIPPQEVSVIAKQSGDTLVPYETKNGRTIMMIEAGDNSASEMFAGAIAGNKMMTWILRGVGVILMFIGFRMVFGVLPIVAAVIPFVGRLVGAGMSLVAGVLTFVCATMTIAIAWLAARPLLGIALLAVAAAVLVLAARRFKPSAVKK